MKKYVLTMFLVVGLIITGATMVIAGQRGSMRHHANPELNYLARIDLSTEQAEKIRTLRLAHEESIAPLKQQEQRINAELKILWLQMTLDTKKIKSAQEKSHDIRFQLLEKETDFRIAMRKVLTREQLTRFLALGSDRCHDPGKSGNRPPRPQQPMRY